MWVSLPDLPDGTGLSLPWVGDPWTFMTASLVRQLLSVAVLTTMLWAVSRWRRWAVVRRARRRRETFDHDFLELDSNLKQTAGGGDSLGLSQCNRCYAIIRADERVCSRCGSSMADSLLGSSGGPNPLPL